VTSKLAKQAQLTSAKRERGTGLQLRTISSLPTMEAEFLK
jgi:hypothetical protein